MGRGDKKLPIRRRFQKPLLGKSQSDITADQINQLKKNPSPDMPFSSERQTSMSFSHRPG